MLLSQFKPIQPNIGKSCFSSFTFLQFENIHLQTNHVRDEETDFSKIEVILYCSNYNDKRYQIRVNVVDHFNSFIGSVCCIFHNHSKLDIPFHLLCLWLQLKFPLVYLTIKQKFSNRMQIPIKHANNINTKTKKLSETITILILSEVSYEIKLMQYLKIRNNLITARSYLENPMSLISYERFSWKSKKLKLRCLLRKMKEWTLTLLYLTAIHDNFKIFIYWTLSKLIFAAWLS